MKLKYKTLEELYSKIGLTLPQIGKRIHKSPHTIRRWKEINDVPERILYQLENLVIYKSNRIRKKRGLVTKLVLKVHKII